MSEANAEVHHSFYRWKEIGGFGYGLHTNGAQKSADTGRLLHILLRAYVLLILVGGDTDQCVHADRVEVGARLEHGCALKKAIAMVNDDLSLLFRLCCLVLAVGKITIVDGGRSRWHIPPGVQTEILCLTNIGQQDSLCTHDRCQFVPTHLIDGAMNHLSGRYGVELWPRPILQQKCTGTWQRHNLDRLKP